MLVSLLLSVDEADKSRSAATRLEKRTIIFGIKAALGDFRASVGREWRLEPSRMTLQETIDAVREWGIAKGITGPDGKGTLLGQLEKTQEELDETRAAARLVLSAESFESHSMATAELIDGLGDVFVTIILAAEMAGLRIEDCLAAAYSEIKGRTGRMEAGVFVKD
jgi:NTP pyrophosphatase (non-canonical NTP hydrolase)